MTPPPYFLLYAHNIPVRGRDRAALYNLQARQVFHIPLVLTDILAALRDEPVAAVRTRFAPNRPDLFDAYLDFLIGNDLGFYTDTPDCFPPLPLDWDTPHHIQTAVIDLCIDSYDPIPLIADLDALLCRHIELRLSKGNGSGADLEAVIAATHDRGFRSITILLDYEVVLAQAQAWTHRVFESCPRIDFIMVYNAPFAGKSRTNPDHIQFIEDNLNTPIQGDLITKRQLIVNFPYFTECHHFNPYYNRRLCISQQGQMKNCLLHERSFGTVGQIPLLAVIESEAFQALWHASPDRTDRLRDSELRYCLFLPYELAQDITTGLFAFPPDSPAWSQVGESGGRRSFTLSQT